jgi:predicted ferric reductase
MRLFSVGLGLGIGALVVWAGEANGRAGDPSAVLRAGGRVAGVFAGFLLLAQILLMSRLRWLARRVGPADLQAVHGEIGSLLTLAVLLHISLAVAGSALADNVSPIARLRTMLTLPDMVSALVGAGILFAVGLSAIRIVRAAMPYELWHAVHMTSYAVLVLTFGHQFSAGTELSHAGVARTVWTGCYVTVLALWVWGRVIEPLRFNLRHRLRVSDVVIEGPHTYSIYLTGRLLREMRAHAGQSLRFRFLTGPYWWQSHPFSLSAAPTGQCLRLTVDIVGKYTERLSRVRPGVRVLCGAPFGVSTANRRTRRRSVVIAAGSGIGPARALLEDLPSGTSLVYRVRSFEDLVFRAELERLAQARGLQIFVVVGSRHDPGPASAMTARGIRFMVPDVRRRDAFVCGPPGLVEAVMTSLEQLGVPQRQVHLLHFGL